MTGEMKVTMRSTVGNLQGKRKRQEGLLCKTLRRLRGPVTSLGSRVLDCPVTVLVREFQLFSRAPRRDKWQ